MSENTDAWQIIHIPEKPPIPPNQQPTVNVVASVIEPKHANILIRRLNQVAPLESLWHVKRIQKRNVEEGKTQLSVILCLVYEDDYQLNSLPQCVQELIQSYQFANLLQHLERSGKSNASYGQLPIIHQPTILRA